MCLLLTIIWEGVGLLVAGLVSSGLGLGLTYITVQGGIGCLWLGEW